MSQVQKLMRRMENRAAAGAGMQRAYLGRVLGPAGTEPGLSREDLQDMQDERCNRLAERLLEVGLEALCAKVELGKGDLSDLFANVARASLVAAEEIYPEATETLRMTAEEYAGSRDLPPATQVGAQSVARAPVVGKEG